MPQYKENRGLPWVIAAVLFLLPWGALLIADVSIWLIVLCTVCSLLTVAACAVMLHGRKRREQALCEQLRLYLAAVEAEAPAKAQSAAELLQCLGEAAAAQKTAHTNSETLTARFLTDWSKKTAMSLDALQASAKRAAFTLPAEERLITQEINTLRCRTEQLMRYFSCDSNCALYRIQSVDLMRVLSDAVIRRSDELKARQIGLRRSATKLRVTSDPVLLAAVLDELLDNAVRHTPSNGAIGLTCREANGCAEVVVEDAGCGIPAEELPRVFERGFVGRGEEVGRAGLGLFTARAYCELLGHSLHVRSAEGKGTQAVLRLQIAPAEKGKETE